MNTLRERQSSSTGHVDDAAERCGLERLRGTGTPLGGVTHATPRLGRLRRQEAALPDRRRRERDAAELGDAARLEALQFAVIDPDLHVRARSGGRTT